MANINVQNVQRMRFRPCTTTSFNVDETTNMSSNNWLDIPFIEGSLSMTLDYPTESPGYARQFRDAHPEEILLPKSWKMSFDVNLSIPDSRATSGVTIAQTPVGGLLGLVMGGEKLGIGDSIAGTSATSNALPVNVAANYSAGQLVAVGDTSSVMHMRSIDRVSGVFLVLKHLVPFTPADADTVYGVANYFCDDWDVDDVETAQFVVEGMGEDDAWIMRGGQGTSTFNIDLPNNGLPKITFNFEGVNWYDDGAVSFSPAALVAASYTNTNEIVCVDCQHLIQANGTTAVTGATYMVTDLTVSPDYYHIKHESSGGTNGVAGFVVDGNHPKCAGSFTIASEDKTWHDARDDKGMFCYQYQIGASEGDGCAVIEMPTVQITDFQRPDGEGIMMANVEFKCREDKETTETTQTALGISPFRIGLV